METNISDIAALVQGGGSAALMVCTWFIYRASERLARIEKALELYMRERERTPP